MRSLLFATVKGRGAWACVCLRIRPFSGLLEETKRKTIILGGPSGQHTCTHLRFKFSKPAGIVLQVKLVGNHANAAWVCTKARSWVTSRCPCSKGGSHAYLQNSLGPKKHWLIHRGSAFSWESSLLEGTPPYLQHELIFPGFPLFRKIIARLKLLKRRRTTSRNPTAPV